jgi:uncharacterized protein YbjT (DUF2867 family)
MQAIKKVLVVGGTGMLGLPVTRALVAAGFEVSALVRGDAARLPKGVRAVTGDVFDPGSVSAALDGQDAMYLNLAIQPTERETDRLTEREGLRVLLDAAIAKKLRRVVALSPLVKDMEGRDGFSWWVFREKQNAERAIMESGVPYTVFRASSFFENLRGGMRRGSAINVAGKAIHPMWFLGGDDYGRMVARALALPSSENRVYYAQGPEALRPDELAKRFIAATTKEQLKLQAAPIGILKLVGWFSRPMGFTATLLDAMNRYPESFEAQATWDELGAPRTSVEDFAARA